MFASSGNFDMNIASYPAYTNVYSVGGIYDDADGFYYEIEIYDRRTMPSSYTGSRISKSFKHFFTYPFNGLWGSNWYN
jgi:hypothetical protein